MDGIKSGWKSLHREEKYTLFQSFAWNRLAAQILAGREAPCVVFAETNGGMAILPAAKGSENLTLLGEELFDYRDILAVGDAEAAALAWKTLGEIGGEVEFRVKAVRESSLDYGFGVPRVPDPAAQIFISEFFANAPKIRCQDPLSGQKHHRLERNLEKMKAAGCEMKIANGCESRLVTEILSLKAMQEDKSLFRDPLRIEMVSRMAAAAGNHCEIFALTHGSTIVAGLITFIDDGWRRLYTTYYDRRWAKYSPGVSLVNYVIGLSVEAGIDVDLMTGEQPYKQRFATTNEALFTLRASASALRERSADIATELPIAA